MTWHSTSRYNDIPGTTIFAARAGAQGLPPEPVLHEPDEGREPRALQGRRARLPRRVAADAEEQKQAVLDRDYNRMIAEGGNIYFLAKIFATDGLSFQQMAGTMTGMTEASTAT